MPARPKRHGEFRGGIDHPPVHPIDGVAVAIRIHPPFHRRNGVGARPGRETFFVAGELGRGIASAPAVVFKLILFSRRIIDELFEGMEVSDEVRRNILGLNAARLFGLEPKVATSEKVAA